MSCNTNSPNVNKTFIIEPLSLTGGSPTLTACTALYTNLVESCSGDTSISLGTGLVTFNSNVNGINSFTAVTIEATTYLSGGTNILDIINTNDTFLTGGTFTNSSDLLTLRRNDGANILITGITDTFVTGGTYDNNTGLITFDTNYQLSAFTVDLNSLDLNDTFLTGGTLNNDTLSLRRNDGVSIDVTGFTNISLFNDYTGQTETLINSKVSFIDAQNYYVNVTGDTMSGPLYVNSSLSANTAYLKTIPTKDNTATDLLVRNKVTGKIDYRDVPSLIGYSDTATTTNNVLTQVSTISGFTSDTSRFVEVYVTAHNNSNNYGFWKRTLMVNNVSGISNIVLETADIDKQSSGMTPVNLIFSGVSDDILILVSGETSVNYNWVINWEIKNH